MQYGAREQIDYAKTVKKHLVITLDELQHLAEKEVGGFELGDDLPRDDAAHNHCLDHPEHRLDLYCRNCDKYLCTKCLIKKRDEHYDHDVTEVEELLAQATQDLDRNVHLNRQL